jgi:hypothetical protein
LKLTILDTRFVFGISIYMKVERALNIDNNMMTSMKIIKLH